MQRSVWNYGWVNHSLQKANPIYKKFFSFENINKLLDKIVQLGYARPGIGEGLFFRMYKTWAAWPGYVRTSVSKYQRCPQLEDAHVEFLNEQFMRINLPDVQSKQVLYDAYDRDRRSPLRPIARPILIDCRMKHPIYTENRLR